MTVKPWTIVVDFGMSLFLVDKPHQSRRQSISGQRLVSLRLHNSMSILWSTSWTACLLFTFYTSGRLVLIFVFRLSSVGLGLGILIDVSSPAHDPNYADEIMFWYWHPFEGFFFVLREITGHSGRALVPEKGQWMSYVGVLPPGGALRTTRRSMFATVSPKCHTAHRHVCPP